MVCVCVVVGDMMASPCRLHVVAAAEHQPSTAAGSRRMRAGWRQSAGRHCEVVTWWATAWGSLILWTVRDTLTLTPSREKPLHQHGDHLDFLIQGEVPGMQEMHFCRRHFALDEEVEMVAMLMQRIV